MNTKDRMWSLPLNNLKFKGNRDYLHGTDILTSILHILESKYPTSTITNIDIAFHSLARSGVSLMLVAPPETQPKAQFSCKINDVRKKFVLIADGRPILERYDYAENQIFAATSIDVKSATATSTRSLPYTNIERWIAMVKALHLALYPTLQGKWLFARGKFDSYQDVFSGDAEHRVTVEANFNNKMTRSALSVNRQKIGDIYFSIE